MEIRYTEEQIKNQEYLIELNLNKDGFSRKKVKITKFTPKKVFFDEYVTRDYRKQLYYKEIGVNLKEGLRLGVNYSHGYVYLSANCLLFEEDVERVENYIKEIAVPQSESVINRLKEQLEYLK